MDDLAQLLDLIAYVNIVLPALVSLHEGDLSTFLPHLQHVHCVLFFDLHHGSSELDPFVEVFKDLLLDGLDIFFLVDSSTIRADSILTY